MEPIINVLAFISIALISYGVGGMRGYNKGRDDEYERMRKGIEEQYGHMEQTNG